MEKQTNKQLTYRPEVDGLRALAVLSVFIYHLNENWLTGGFLGVDIFFVISGYLITRIITTEMASGHFSFKTFYQRRIKRIYPVFILTIALASIFSSLFFIRAEGELLRKTTELAPIFATNFYLAYRQGYWDMSANENPILHLWSLAVEEQYYLFFPIILFFAFKRAKQTAIFIKVVLALLVFFLLTNFLPQSAYEKVGIYNLYYTSNLRFPELLVGSFLALLPASTHSVRNQILSVLSIIGLVFCLFFYQKNTPYLVGMTILLPCVLAAILIYSATSTTLVGRFFSLKPVVWVGKLSYSIYLFHWLFIALTHYVTGAREFSMNTVAFIIFATFICAILSHYLLEQPIRKSTLSFKQAVIFLYLIPSVAVIGYNLAMKKVVVKRTHEYDVISHVNLEPVEFHQKKIAVLGDSHAGHLTQFLNYVGNKEGWNVEGWGDVLKCYGLNGQEPLETLNEEQKAYCAKYQELENNPVVFISMFYNLKRGTDPLPRITAWEFKVDDFDQRLKAMIEHFAKTKKVYVFADVKVADRSPLRSVYLAKYGLDKFLEPIGELGDTKTTNEHLRKLVQDIPNVTFVDPTKYLPEGYFMEGKPLYVDQDHLNNLGSLQMGKGFAEKETLISEEVKEKWLK